MKSRIKWLAGLPCRQGETNELPTTLIRLFYTETPEALLARPRAEIASRIQQGFGCTDSEAADIAGRVVSFLNSCVKMTTTPPSDAEVEAFLKPRQLRFQLAAVLQGLYNILVNDDPLYVSFTIDPLTGQTFHPIWLQLALERILRLPPA